MIMNLRVSVFFVAMSFCADPFILNCVCLGSFCFHSVVARFRTVFQKDHQADLVKPWKSTTILKMMVPFGR